MRANAIDAILPTLHPLVDHSLPRQASLALPRAHRVFAHVYLLKIGETATEQTSRKHRQDMRVYVCVDTRTTVIEICPVGRDHNE
jgi:hypothetical protein